jgi:4-hydroxybenzoate polyprenyltransferase
MTGNKSAIGISQPITRLEQELTGISIEMRQVESVKNQAGAALLNLVLKYRIHITLLYAVSLFLISQKNTANLNLISIFCFSLCHAAFHFYNRACDRDADLISNPREALTDIREVQKLKNISYSMAILGVLIMIFLNKAILLILISAGMAFLYNHFFGINVKRIFFFKNLYMALFYAIPFCFYMHAIWGAPFEPQFGISFLNYLFTVLAIEALWDIKDMEGDRFIGVVTIANKFGVINTKLYAGALMIGGWFFQYYLFGNIVYFSTFLITYYLIFLRRNCSVWHYHGPLLAVLFPTLFLLFFS